MRWRSGNAEAVRRRTTSSGECDRQTSIGKGNQCLTCPCQSRADMDCNSSITGFVVQIDYMEGESIVAAKACLGGKGQIGWCSGECAMRRRREDAKGIG